jgi:hypothetical protein
MYGSFSAYDQVTGMLYHHGALDEASLVVYDPAEDKWGGPYGSSYVEHYVTAAVDPSRRIMVATGGKDDRILVWNIDGLGSPVNPGSPSTPGTFGERMLESANAPGFVFDPVSDSFVGWSGGASVYTLDPDTWVWSKIDPATGNAVTPTAPNEMGTYGRFRYIPSKNAFILVNRTNENVFFYKLTPGSGPPGTGGGPPGAGSPDGSGGGTLDKITLLGLLLMLAAGWNRISNERRTSTSKRS